MSCPIWTYWEGPMPEYIEVCLASMRRVLRSDLRLVIPEKVDNLLGEKLHPNWQLLRQPALRADAIRAGLLATYGGWWWDADTIALRHPSTLEHIYCHAEALYSIWDRLPFRVLNGYIYFESGSPIALEWLERVNVALVLPDKVDWTDIGERLLTSKLLESQTAMRLPRRLVLPIDIDSNVKEFFQPHPLDKYLRDDTICFGLNHSWFMYHEPAIMNLPSNRWAKSPLLIHQLLNYARSKEVQDAA